MAISEIYIKLIVGFPKDPKVRSLAQFGADAGLARDLYVQMCLYCKDMLSDGFVPEYELGVLVWPLDLEHGKQLAKQLASVGLTKESSKAGASGWDVLAYLRRNGSREDVERLSKVRAEAGRTGGKAKPKRAGQRGRQASGKQVANQDAEQNGSNSVSVSESVKTTDSETEIQTPTESAAESKHAVADALAAAFWDVHKAATAQSFLAVRQVIRTAIANGKPRNDVARALDQLAKEGRAISGGSITTALQIRGTQHANGSMRGGARQQLLTAEETNALDEKDIV